MKDPREPIALSEPFLALMRRAATAARHCGDPFISVRALLLALIDDPEVGAALAVAIPRERLEEHVLRDDDGTRAGERSQPEMPEGEAPAMARFDTLAFKEVDSVASMWLSHEALAILLEGAQRVDGPYLPKHLAFGIAAEAKRTPATLTRFHLDAGVVLDAMYKL